MRLMGWRGSIVLAALPTALFSCVVLYVIPALGHQGLAPPRAWLVAGAAFFFLLLSAGLVAVTAEMRKTRDLTRRLRIHPLSRADSISLLHGLIAAGAATGAIIGVRVLLGLPAVARPPFLDGAGSIVAEAPGLLPLWAAFVLLNVASEEVWWRGFLQPRQELRFGNGTWVLQGALHTAFHFSFGLGVVATLIPTAFCLPWLAQRTRSTTVAAAAHLCINGLGVLAVLMAA